MTSQYCRYGTVTIDTSKEHEQCSRCEVRQSTFLNRLVVEEKRRRHCGHCARHNTGVGDCCSKSFILVRYGFVQLSKSLKLLWSRRDLVRERIGCKAKVAETRQPLERALKSKTAPEAERCQEDRRSTCINDNIGAKIP